ncbi:MAG TPA: hypothetical protein VHQ45_02075 [Gemmatimonadaceae bacterium]|nr:hypothetical protein [Gemmatimonadaceae bacterium]
MEPQRSHCFVVTRAAVGAAALAVLLAACSTDTSRDAARGADSAAASDSAVAPVLAGSIDGLHTPEAVRYDPDQDVYFVANINGRSTDVDGNGYIARVHPDSLGAPNLAFIRGGRNGVTLDAPKGMALIGDTLWVADIHAVRAFHRRTGAPLASVDLTASGADFLNDVAVGPDGALLVTDTRANRIFRIAGRTVTVATGSDTLASPNGITWDAAGRRWIVVPFGGPAIWAWTPGQPPATIAAGRGEYDGVEILADGRILVSDWTDSTVKAVGANGAITTLVTGVESPGDIGVDTRRSRVLIPLLTPSRVVVYELR